MWRGPSPPSVSCRPCCTESRGCDGEGCRGAALLCSRTWRGISDEVQAPGPSPPDVGRGAFCSHLRSLMSGVREGSRRWSSLWSPPELEPGHVHHLVNVSCFSTFGMFVFLKFLYDTHFLSQDLLTWSYAGPNGSYFHPHLIVYRPLNVRSYQYL